MKSHSYIPCSDALYVCVFVSVVSHSLSCNITTSHTHPSYRIYTFISWFSWERSILTLIHLHVCVLTHCIVWVLVSVVSHSLILWNHTPRCLVLTDLTMLNFTIHSLSLSLIRVVMFLWGQLPRMDTLRQFRDCWRQEPTSTTRTRLILWLSKSTYIFLRASLHTTCTQVQVLCGWCHAGSQGLNDCLTNPSTTTDSFPGIHISVDGPGSITSRV